MPIFDQGYQHWSGQLSGHALRWLAISRHGVRIGMKNMFLRLAIMFAWLPAVVLGLVLCVWGLMERKSPMVAFFRPLFEFMGPIALNNPREFRVEAWTIFYEYFLLAEMRISMILVLIVGPSLISQDLRFNALPLYFSRPLRRIDYFVGKLGVIVYFLSLVLVVPSLIAYAIGLLFSLDFSIIADTYRVVFASVAFGALVAIVSGSLILALSSLTRNSRYVALFWLGMWFVTGIAGQILIEADFEHRREQRSRVEYEEYERARHEGRNLTPEQLVQQTRTTRQKEENRYAEFMRQENERAKRNWRPMVSYTANLARIGQQMLGSDACWDRIAESRVEMTPAQLQRFLASNKGAQYPWYWSAAVLAALMGISACILNFRIKSLDRLR